MTRNKGGQVRASVALDTDTKRSGGRQLGAMAPPSDAERMGRPKYWKKQSGRARATPSAKQSRAKRTAPRDELARGKAKAGAGDYTVGAPSENEFLIPHKNADTKMRVSQKRAGASAGGASVEKSPNISRYNMVQNKMVQKIQTGIFILIYRIMEHTNGERLLKIINYKTSQRIKFYCLTKII